MRICGCCFEFFCHTRGASNIATRQALSYHVELRCASIAGGHCTFSLRIVLVHRFVELRLNAYSQMNQPPQVALIIETSVIYGRRILAGVARYLRSETRKNRGLRRLRFAILLHPWIPTQ
jgi:hypothetical protein